MDTPREWTNLARRGVMNHARHLEVNINAKEPYGYGRYGV